MSRTNNLWRAVFAGKALAVTAGASPLKSAPVHVGTFDQGECTAANGGALAAKPERTPAGIWGYYRACRATASRHRRFRAQCERR